MNCWDESTSVEYPQHEEFVAPGAIGGTPLGICCRCGEILDLAACRREAARGDKRCQEALRKADLGHLTEAEKDAESALARLTDEQRKALIRRHGS